MSYFARELAKAQVSPICSLKAANPSIQGSLTVFENGIEKTLYVGTQYQGIDIQDPTLSVQFQ